MTLDIQNTEDYPFKYMKVNQRVTQECLVEYTKEEEKKKLKVTNNEP